MKRNGLLVLAMVFGLAAAANASSVSVAFDKEEAEPGDTVLLMVSGVANTASDALLIDLALTSPGSLPDPNGPTWDDSAVWDPPFDLAQQLGFAGILQTGPILTCDAFLQIGTFTSGDILTIEMVIPDDGSVGFCDYIDVDVDYAEFAYQGTVEEVPEAGRGSDSIHIIPEPMTISLLAVGAFGALIRRKRR